MSLVLEFVFQALPPNGPFQSSATLTFDPPFPWIQIRLGMGMGMDIGWYQASLGDR